MYGTILKLGTDVEKWFLNGQCFKPGTHALPFFTPVILKQTFKNLLKTQPHVAI